jgi:hypothetical protein
MALYFRELERLAEASFHTIPRKAFRIYIRDRNFIIPSTVQCMAGRLDG